MKRTKITNKIKDGFSELPFDTEVWLYGSEARGDARPDSDIDILVLLDKQTIDADDEDAVFKITYPIELETGVIINPVIRSKKQWESRVTPFRINVEHDRVML